MCINSVRPELVEGEGNIFKIRRLHLIWFMVRQAHHERETGRPRTGLAHSERHINAQFDKLTANGIVRLTANGVNKLTVNGGYVTDCTGLRKIKNTRVS